MPSIAGCTPRLRSAEPAKTGKIFPASVPLRRAARSSGAGTASPARYFSAAASSTSAAASSSASRYRAHDSLSASESGARDTPAPWSSAENETFSIVTRSATAPNVPSSPSGTVSGTPRALSLRAMSSTTRSKSAPGRSSLLTNARRGIPCRSACRQTTSDCGSTPPTPQNIATAPSSTRSDRSTSMVKSTWPGVSIRWTSAPSHEKCVAAAVIVIPRSFSCGR